MLWLCEGPTLELMVLSLSAGEGGERRWERTSKGAFERLQQGERCHSPDRQQRGLSAELVLLLLVHFLINAEESDPIHVKYFSLHHLLRENAISSMKPLIACTRAPTVTCQGWHADRGHFTVRKTSIHLLSTGVKLTLQWQARFLVLVNVNGCLSLYVCLIISWKVVQVATCL